MSPGHSLLALLSLLNLAHLQLVNNSQILRIRRG